MFHSSSSYIYFLSSLFSILISFLASFVFSLHLYLPNSSLPVAGHDGRQLQRLGPGDRRSAGRRAPLLLVVTIICMKGGMKICNAKCHNIYQNPNLCICHLNLSPYAKQAGKSVVSYSNTMHASPFLCASRRETSNMHQTMSPCHPKTLKKCRQYSNKDQIIQFIPHLSNI